MKKKFLSVFLTLVMIITVLSKNGLNVNADGEEVIIDSIIYNLNENANEATVKGVSGVLTENVTILPEIVKDDIKFKVTEISENAFVKRKDLKEINIPDSVNEIGKAAFACSGVETVTISKSVTTIKECTFICCQNLKNVIIPTGLVNIGQHAFDRCEKLENIEIPDSVITIERSAFIRSNLTNLVIPEGVREISQGI